MMRNQFQALLPILGVIVIIFQLMHIGGDYRGLDSPIWGFLLGFGLIVSPFTALGMLLVYLLMLVFIVGFPILGAYIGAQIMGKDSIGVWLGLIGGGIIGFKIATGDFFDTLVSPLRKVAEQDDKE
ncbi:hypothetical protein [Acinetobacter sp. XH1639]|uniref:hypothetical protein n=1 Tax=Acinetobacter sp. XH1639 TaxID=3157368 RepID=UPI0032B43E8F